MSTPTITTSASDVALAHALARVGLGLNLALHGLVRLPDLTGFAAGLTEGFAGSLLPTGLVYAASLSIPVAEAILGPLIVAGLWLRGLLAASSVYMMVLIAGSCFSQNWGAASTQMIYLGFHVALIATASWDRYSVDARRGRG